jgi:hypothetical protein
MFRDDDAARTARASALIDEIAELEREKLARAANQQRDAERLDAAKRDLAMLQEPKRAAAPKAASVLAHVAVFATTAIAAYVGYVVFVC